MSDEEERLVKIRTRFEDLCRALNMDEEASTEAWSSYENISRNFTLEGSELHWLACALYVACRSSVPTVGKGTTEGNYVSLTRVLRCSHISLIEFFSKMKKWQDMAKLPQDFCQSTDKLERNFTVSAVIFKKYVPIFRSIFKTPSEELLRVHRSRKQRRHPCSVSELFNFCWVLYVHAKGNFPMISDDLVNSYHLLLCALDLVLTNALLCSARRDLLNPSFKGLPEDFSSRDYRPPPGPLCFMEQLCELHDGLVLEAKGVKEHFWKPFIKKLFHKRILRGKEDSLSGFLDPMNFGDSFLSLSRLYEEQVLASGGLDERIFTGEGASEDIGTPEPSLCEEVENQDSTLYRLHTSLAASVLKVSTPLTGRKYVQEVRLASPLSTAMKSVGRLHTLLSGTRYGPSSKLTQILRGCSRDPSDVISQRLKDMLDIFTQHHEDSTDDSKGMEKDMAVKFFHLSEALYYRILESIVEREKMILGDADLSCILEQDVFHRSLLACCLEIVTFSYRPPGDFPRVIHTFQLPAYHFYKVIEVLVRSEQGLFREVVKHLNQVEEQVLESLAWTSNSPLWHSLQSAQVPTCQENLTSTLAIQSAVTKPVTKAVSSPLRRGSLSLFFRKVFHLASVRLRDLCVKLDIPTDLRRKIWTCFEHSLVHSTDMMKDRHLDQLLMCAVYVMAKVTKEDRSFQNIMKCYRTQPQASSNVYRSVLISGSTRPSSTTDTNQSSSSDSRKDPAGGDISPGLTCSSSTLVTPQPSGDSSSSAVDGGEEERGDLIHFYNDVYIKQMRQFAVRYSRSSPSTGADPPPLCPYPTSRTGSPRRMLLSSKHSIYISPHESGSAPCPALPRERICYYICSSPPNRLQEINSMIRTGETPSRKRSIPLDKETSPKRVCPDNHTALLRRLQDIANDRSSSR
uniref:Retinoblastoma-like protein 2 n=1 Tax=Nothobranchius furzeri TaxID=105023 RepID=A0A1A7Z9A2_NOTFU